MFIQRHPGFRKMPDDVAELFNLEISKKNEGEGERRESKEVKEVKDGGEDEYLSCGEEEKRNGQE